MRTILHDPAVAWHLRTFESWGTRTDFSKWTEYEWHDIATDGHEGGKLDEITSEYWSEAEYEYFEGYFRTGLDLPGVDTDPYMGVVRDGQDKWLKAILLAHCPRLRNLAFMRYSADDDMTHPVHAIVEVICFIHLNRQSISDPVRWPAGFQSLRTLSVGVETKHRDVTPGEGYCLDPRDVALLLLLPNLETLSICGIQDAENRYLSDESEEFEPPARRSPVQHLHLQDAYCGLQPIVQLFMVIKSLKSVLLVDCDIIEGDGDGWDESMIEHLTRAHAESLESLLFSIISTPAREAYPVPYPRYDPSLTRHLKQLRHVSINLRDLYSRYPNSTSDAQQCSHSGTLRGLLEGYLPPSLEVLHICDDSDRMPTDDFDSLPTDALDGLDNALLHLLLSGACPKLAVIDLRGLVYDIGDEVFGQTLARGNTMDVQFLLKGEQSSIPSIIAGMPRPVTEQDLLTSPGRD
ncbi:hypothetical protein LTR85_004472 [Meristemomyces frigidus]|nr:hypothetical protein LTR85_004472 [Meristemomyces frigidus]